MAEWTEAESTESGRGTTISSTEPSNPSRGDEWVDDSYRKPAKKVYMGDGEWATLVPGSNVPGEQTYTAANEVDVSDINQSVRIRLVAETGEGTGNGPGGAGGAGIVEVDLTSYDEIRVRPGNLEGSNPCGNDGCRVSYGGSKPNGSHYFPGRGGAGTALVDSDDSIIAVAGGGGGEGDSNYAIDDGYSWYQGSSGGDGGPTGDPVSGRGGYWDELGGTEKRGYNRAEAGAIAAKKDAATVVSANTARDKNAKVDMFI